MTQGLLYIVLIELIELLEQYYYSKSWMLDSRDYLSWPLIETDQRSREPGRACIGI